MPVSRTAVRLHGAVVPAWGVGNEGLRAIRRLFIPGLGVGGEGGGFVRGFKNRFYLRVYFF